MTCREIQDILSAYIDGELTPQEMDTVKRHLDACPDCREVHQQMLRLVQLVGALPAAQPPADFLNQVKASCRKNAGKHQVMRRLAWAACLVLAMLIFVFFQRQPHLAPPAAKMAEAPARTTPWAEGEAALSQDTRDEETPVATVAEPEERVKQTPPDPALTDHSGRGSSQEDTSLDTSASREPATTHEKRPRQKAEDKKQRPAPATPGKPAAEADAPADATAKAFRREATEDVDDFGVAKKRDNGYAGEMALDGRIALTFTEKEEKGAGVSDRLKEKPAVDQRETQQEEQPKDAVAPSGQDIVRQLVKKHNAHILRRDSERIIIRVRRADWPALQQALAHHFVITWQQPLQGGEKPFLHIALSLH